MRISLFVAMANSIHTTRWVNQISDQGWDIHLFPSIDNGELHPDLKNVTVSHSFYSKKGIRYQNVKFYGLHIHRELVVLALKIIKRLFPNYRIFQLRHIIKKIKPDIIQAG